VNAWTEPPRYEIKIECDSALLPQVLAWVRLDPAHWRPTYPPRQVNNIYFDTADNGSLNDNLSGVGERHKLRVRWYGPALHRLADARLELKRREGSVGCKEICPLDMTLDLPTTPWPVVCRRLQESVEPRARAWLTPFAFPVLINHYWRVYYATPDQALRLTVDSGLHAYDQRFSTHPNLCRPAPLAERVIIELKGAPEQQPRLSEVLARLPFRPGRCSKYIYGMLAGVDLE
jgi:hypothetical protein